MKIKTNVVSAMVGFMAFSLVVGCGGGKVAEIVDPGPQSIECPDPSASDVAPAETDVVSAEEPCVSDPEVEAGASTGSEPVGVEGDLTPPVVTRIQAVRNDAANGGAFLHVYFSEAISARDIQVDNMTISPAVTITQGVRRGRGNSLFLYTEDVLTPDAVYTITFGAGSVQDLVGNLLLESEPWEFVAY